MTRSGLPLKKICLSRLARHRASQAADAQRISLLRFFKKDQFVYIFPGKISNVFNACNEVLELIAELHSIR